MEKAREREGEAYSEIAALLEHPQDFLDEDEDNDYDDDEDDEDAHHHEIEALLHHHLISSGNNGPLEIHKVAEPLQREAGGHAAGEGEGRAAATPVQAGDALLPAGGETELFSCGCPLVNTIPRNNLGHYNRIE